MTLPFLFAVRGKAVFLDFGVVAARIMGFQLLMNLSHFSRLTAPIYLAACVVLGGASQGGYIANALLQITGALLIATFVLLRASWQFGQSPTDAWQLRLLVLIFGIGIALCLASLLPLPNALWSHLPHRGQAAGGYALLQMPPIWNGISLTPDATVNSALSVVPPLAMIVALIVASPDGRRASLFVLIVAALVSILFGVFQQATGFHSSAYIYDETSRGGAVGFFANRNHLATLCLMTMPFVAALAAMAQDLRLFGAHRSTQLILFGAVMLFLTLGALVVQSLAGWLLLVPTLLGCLLVFRSTKRGRGLSFIAAVAAIVLAAAIFAAVFAPLSPRDLNQTLGEVNPQLRHQIMLRTLHAAGDYMPVGSGLGSFMRLYPHYELAAEVTNTQINHAHNDYLELVLEMGIGGVMLLLGFLAWFARVSWQAWRMPQATIARAASVSIMVLLAHSLVDYPARTAAIAAVAGLACAFLILPKDATLPSSARTSRGGRSRAISLAHRPMPRSR